MIVVVPGMEVNWMIPVMEVNWMAPRMRVNWMIPVMEVNSATTPSQLLIDDGAWMEARS